MNWDQSNCMSSSNGLQSVEFSYVLNNNYEMIESCLNISNNQQFETNKPTTTGQNRLKERSLNGKWRKGTQEWEMLKLEKRNARERNRVRQVNKEFDRLRQVLVRSDFLHQLEESESENNRTRSDSSLCLDFLMDKENCEDEYKKTGRCKKLSKLRILKLAIDYIEHLAGLLQHSGDSKGEGIGLYTNTLTCSSPEDFSLSIKSEENYYFLPFEEQHMDELQRFDLSMRAIKAQMVNNKSCDFDHVGFEHFEAYHF
jgi:hypothetical protein